MRSNAHRSAISRHSLRFVAARSNWSFEQTMQRLAEAFQAEHGYGPQVTVAIDQSHRDMGELQKETLAHIFAMRAMLKPDQARKLDQVVVEALTADSQ